MRINFGKILVRGAGVAGLLLVGRDAHVMGKYIADANAKDKISRNTQKYLQNTMYLDKPSVTDAKIKNRILKWQLENGLQEPFYAGTGYFKGFFNTLADKLLPFALSIGALIGGNKLSKGSAIGLAVYGAYKFVTQGLGIGRKHPI